MKKHTMMKIFKRDYLHIHEILFYLDYSLYVFSPSHEG
ncbi:hypothetical protein LTSEURB_6786 [Salmonella enterica subsp. enterica serovar Urbana str. R8-2977]|uniref:Uncharacterized protein n=1 Tax=Salmonella enterica subsp. enterica serovar Urbana str. R8-2977 TaxID=913084 RepID=G5S5H7_SALET|nr:hypothetical protein LTSEURB_6786 [Salmonella enterica subsp. enterica serovar Urbana str. R8-2977]